jgi:hypothetical protein
LVHDHAAFDRQNRHYAVICSPWQGEKSDLYLGEDTKLDGAVVINVWLR